MCAGRSLESQSQASDWIATKYPGALYPVEAMELDLANFQSVRAFVKAFQKQFPARKHRLAVLVGERTHVIGWRGRGYHYIVRGGCACLFFVLLKHEHNAFFLIVIVLGGQVNNAGVMATPPSWSADNLELQMATNHLGPFLLTSLLMPRLAAGDSANKNKNKDTDAASSTTKDTMTASRVVNVASMAHAMPLPASSFATPSPSSSSSLEIAPLALNATGAGVWGRWAAYARSKRANILSAQGWAQQFSGGNGGGSDGASEGVSFVSVCPGNVRTQLGKHSFVAYLAYEMLPFRWFHKSPAQVCTLAA